jgi:hypothetical protein
VMEYAPTNVWPRGLSHGSYFQTTLGPYDYHVIHWGYAPVPGAHSPDDEVPTLNRWAASAVDPKYAFSSDEDVEYDGHAVDPRIAQYMLTNDSFDWSQTQLGLAKSLLSSIDSRYPAVQQPWEQERFALEFVMFNYNRYSTALTHYIAGEHLSRARRGDPGAPMPLTPVGRAEEAKAAMAINRYVFSDEAWNSISPDTLRRSVYSEYESFTGFGYNPTLRHDISLTATVGALQDRVLAYEFSPLVLQRLDDLPTKAKPGQTMTLADLFTWTQTGVYGDLQNDRLPKTAIHRNLQRQYARLLSQMAVAPWAGTPFDAQALARYELGQLDGDVKRNLMNRSLDVQTRAHLVALQTDVERALDTRYVFPVAAPEPKS